MKREENAIPAPRARLARIQVFYKSENAKEIVFKVEFQSMKTRAGSGADPAPTQELPRVPGPPQPPSTWGPGNRFSWVVPTRGGLVRRGSR